MGEAVFFRNLTTKGLTAVNSGERYFEGYLTVQVKDKQGEVTIVDELMKVLPVWIDRGAPISDTHSNRIIGKGINYSKVEYKDKDGEIYPAIKVTGKIHKNYELDNDIWMKIKSGEYKGLSFGGATKSDREPMRMKDGSIAYSLKDLEHYEVAVCRDPAVPLALITEFNTLAKAAVDGQDLGDGRMLIKCDKFGCYVDKENREAGLKAPEARNEALVYDDKTHDQPSETPEENQKKIKKGRWDKPKEPNRHKTIVQNGHGTLFEAFSEDDEEYKHLSEEGKKLYHEQEAKWRKDNPDTEEVEKGEREHPSKEESQAIIDGKIPGAFGDRNTDMYKKPTDLGKGQDWSNADGDMQTSMNTQNVDEGGMGRHKQKGCKCGDPKCKDPKCKKHKREVGTGHGAEQNDAGEVGWSGSGSPYPKKKGDEDESKEEEEDKKFEESWNKLNPSESWYAKKRKKKKELAKKAVITNIYTRLKNLDTLYKRNEDDDEEQDEVSAEHKTHNTPVPLKTHGKWIKATDGHEYYVEFPEYYPTGTVDSGGKPGKTGKRKKKAVITNIHTRLKNLDFLLRTEEATPGHYDSDDKIIPTKRKKKADDYIAGKGKKSRWWFSLPQTSGKKKDPKKKKKKGPRQAERDEYKKNPDPEVQANYDKNIEEMEAEAGKKKSYFMRVKDGEFGGMNTGEVEHTEPRDTANSRTKRDKDVA